jgi:DNA polymerase III subunit delta'
MPWTNIIGHDKQKELLRLAIQRQRLPNAYLFTGQEGIGKEAVALYTAQVLNCESPAARETAEACGVCESCRQFAELTHPNLELVFPIEAILLKNVSETSQDREKQDDAVDKLKHLYARKKENPYFTMAMDKAMGILTGQIEELIRKSAFKPIGNKKRIYLISQAERMNIEAANKLLKLLEEPPPFVLFILVSSRPEQILPTIVSRCQPLRFSAISSDHIETKLAESKFSEALSSDERKFIARYARGSVALALEMAADKTMKDIRDSAMDFLRFALSSGKQLELMRKVEDIAKSSREAQTRVLCAVLNVFHDVARVRAVPDTRIINADVSDAIQRFAKNFERGDFERASKDTEDAIYAIARNANPTLTWTALSLKVSAALKKTVQVA